MKLDRNNKIIFSTSNGNHDTDDENILNFPKI